MTQAGRYAADPTLILTGPKTAVSPIGGLLTRLINKTGANSVKGTVVELDDGVDFAFDIAPVDAIDAFGIVYEDGIADGDECWVVTYGAADILIEDGTASTRDNFVKVGDTTPGRALMDTATPASQAIHFRELGHCMESQGAGADVLAR